MARTALCGKWIRPERAESSPELDRPYGQLYRGPERIEALFREMTGRWSEIRFTTSNPLVGGESVVLDAERTAQSRQGAFAVSSSLTARLTIREGRIAYFKLFQRRADAIKAAGLSEWQRGRRTACLLGADLARVGVPVGRGERTPKRPGPGNRHQRSAAWLFRQLRVAALYALS